MKSSLLQVLCLAFLLSGKCGFAQWQQLPGPDCISASVVYQHAGNIFISNDINQIYNGVYRSNNNGSSWVDVSAGLSAPHAKAFCSIGTDLFAVVDTNVFMTGNLGSAWTDVSSNLPSNGFISGIATLNGNLYVSVYTGLADEIFYSVNNGVSWQTTGFFAPVSDFFTDGNKLWSCGSNGAIYVTTDGINWILKAGNIPFSAYVRCIGGSGDTMYCSYAYNVYMTTDGGNLWMPTTNGLPPQATGQDIYISGNSVFLGTLNDGVYTTALGSGNWTQFGTGFPNYESSYSITTNGNFIFSASYDALWSNALSGGAWNLSVNGLRNGVIRTIYAEGNFILAGIGSNLGLYYSNDGGLTWSPTSIGVNSYVSWVKKIGTTYWTGSGAGGPLYSSDGITWNGIPNFFNGSFTIIPYGNQLLNAGNNGVDISSDNGMTWTATNNGLPANPQVYNLIAMGTNIYAFINGKGVYRSTDGGINWTSYNTGLSNLNSFYNMIGVDGFLVLDGFMGKYRRSENDTAWSLIPSSSFVSAYDYITSGKTIFAASNDGVYISDDIAESWHAWNNGFNPFISEVRHLFIDGNLLYAASHGFGIWKRNHFPQIRTASIPAGPHCPGDNITVNFTSTATFNPGNQFIVQLSDSSGHWINNPLELDTVTSTSPQPITVIVPSGIKQSDHYRIRVIATDPYVVGEDNGNDISINKPPVITLQPANQNVCAGNNAGFYVGANGSSISYQWQIDSTGLGWQNIAGGIGPLLMIGNVTASMNGYQFHCVINGICPLPVTSNSATLFVSPPPVITQQPVNDTVCESSAISFNCVAIGLSVSYQWQYDNGNGFFTNVPSFPPYSGVTTSTLTIANAPASFNRNLYRCVINDGCRISDTSQLIVNGTPVSNTPASTVNACNGTANFYVYVPGEGITYQWQENNGGGFVNLSNGGNYSGVDSSHMTIINVNASMNGYIYKCVINGLCPPFTSNSNEQTLDALATFPVITTQPGSITKCEGVSAYFAMAASGASINYQWQLNTGSGWSSLIDVYPFSGSSTDTLLIDTVGLSMNGWQFRCVVSGCPVTNAATLTVNSLPNVGLSQFPSYFCYNDPIITLSGGLPAGGTYYGNGVYNSLFSPATAGIGNVMLTYNYTNTSGCTSSASQILTVANCVGVGMSETYETENSWLLYPNPASDYLTVKINSVRHSTTTLKIVNTIGQIVLTKKINCNESCNIDVRDFANGFYIVSAVDDRKFHNKRLLILR